MRTTDACFRFRPWRVDRLLHSSVRQDIITILLTLLVRIWLPGVWRVRERCVSRVRRRYEGPTFVGGVVYKLKLRADYSRLHQRVTQQPILCTSMDE